MTSAISDPPGQTVLGWLTATSARTALADWLVLYTACFSSPPWNEPAQSLPEYAEAVGWHFDQPGFRAVQARAASGSLVGVAYGWTCAEMPPDRPFYRALAAGIGPGRLMRLWSERPFEVAEVMVEPGARGQGLGRRLLEALCVDSPVCWLATRPDAPAAAVYRHLGWQRFGSFATTAGVDLDAYVLDRRIPR